MVSTRRANAMSLNGSITGHIGFYYNHARDTIDWYKFTTTGDGLVNLQLASSNGQNVYWQLYDGKRNYLSQWNLHCRNR